VSDRTITPPKAESYYDAHALVAFLERRRGAEAGSLLDESLREVLKHYGAKNRELVRLDRKYRKENEDDFLSPYDGPLLNELHDVLSDAFCVHVYW
jgi:hypothetical protein